MLSDDDLAWMRVQQEEALPDRCVILRPATTRNEIGEGSVAWGTVAGTVACRLASPAQQSGYQITGQRTELVAPWVVTMAHDQDVATGDRLVIAGRTFEVRSVARGNTWATARRIQALELE